MRRRDFIAGAAASVVPEPRRARAQATKLPVVGVLWHAANAQEEAPFLEPLRDALRGRVSRDDGHEPAEVALALGDREAGHPRRRPAGQDRDALRGLGYVEGKNIALELRFPAERPELFASMAHDLVERRVDVLVAVTPVAAAAAKHATSTIPTVFVIHPNPVEAGIVASLAHPAATSRACPISLLS